MNELGLKCCTLPLRACGKHHTNINFWGVLQLFNVPAKSSAYKTEYCFFCKERFVELDQVAFGKQRDGGEMYNLLPKPVAEPRPGHPGPVPGLLCYWPGAQKLPF
jgi:hypothetical protein